MIRATQEAHEREREIEREREREHGRRVSLSTICCMPANSTYRTSCSTQVDQEDTRQAALKEKFRGLIRGSCSRLKHFESEPYNIDDKRAWEIYRHATK